MAAIPLGIVTGIQPHPLSQRGLSIGMNMEVLDFRVDFILFRSSGSPHPA